MEIRRWNSTFPTREEQIVWRVFSLVALIITWPLYFKYLWSFYCLWRILDDKEERVSSDSWSKPSDLFFVLMWLFCYATARWGSVILMFISLRALPAGSYTTVDWLSSIPHIWCRPIAYVLRCVVVIHVCLVEQCQDWTPFPLFTLVARIKAKKRIPMIIIFSPSVRTTSPRALQGCGYAVIPWFMQPTRDPNIKMHAC